MFTRGMKWKHEPCIDGRQTSGKTQDTWEYERNKPFGKN